MAKAIGVPQDHTAVDQNGELTLQWRAMLAEMVRQLNDMQIRLKAAETKIAELSP